MLRVGEGHSGNAVSGGLTPVKSVGLAQVLPIASLSGNHLS